MGSAHHDRMSEQQLDFFWGIGIGVEHPLSQNIADHALVSAGTMDDETLIAAIPESTFGAYNLAVEAGRRRLVAAVPDAAGHWPWATFCANVAGAFALGYFATRLQERLPLSAYRRPLLGTGLCGAFTTFSTMQLELLRMIDAGRLWLAAGYAGTSLAAGFLAIVLSTALVRRVRVIV